MPEFDIPPLLSVSSPGCSFKLDVFLPKKNEFGGWTTHLQNMLVKLIISPTFGVNMNNIWSHHLVLYCWLMLPAESIIEWKQIIALQSTLLRASWNFVISVSLTTPFSNGSRLPYIWNNLNLSRRNNLSQFASMYLEPNKHQWNTHCHIECIG